MANNDRLQPIISNVQMLCDLVNSMKDAEIFPVSFFSQAFDLIQKTQSDLHLIEADQVEMFASQMKKHQELILSIHRQMRCIEGLTPSVPPTPPEDAAPDRPDVRKEPAETPAAKAPATGKRPVKSAPVPSETAKTSAKSTLTIPAASPTGENPARITGSPTVKDPAKKNKMPEDKAAGLPAENSLSPSVNDAIEKQILSDLRRAFNLNDRFRYRRELFRDDEEIMNRVITILNSKTSYRDSIRFLEEKLHWDFNNPIVKEFIKVLETRFL